jgi:hypothetical protein
VLGTGAQTRQGGGWQGGIRRLGGHWDLFRASSCFDKLSMSEVFLVASP